MRCTQFEKLLPLYVGDDLAKAGERAEAADHLASCAACRLKAEEFEAGRRLLALHAPPAFDEAFFAGVRRNVMREIEDEKRRPAPFAAFRNLFAPRTSAFAAAAALALLVACALVAFQLYRRAVPSQTTPPETAATTPQTTTAPRLEDAPSEQTDKAHAPGVAQHTDAARHDGPGQQNVGAPSTPHPLARTTRRVVLSQTQTVAQRDASPVAPSSANEAVRTPQPEAVAAVNHSATPTEAAERKLTRIELQTGDPNVRIIWLSPGADDKPAIQRETKR